MGHRSIIIITKACSSWSLNPKLLYLLRELQHNQGGDDELHKEVQKVADNMIKNPEYQEVMMKEFEVDKVEEERRAANQRNAAIQESLDKLKSSIAGSFSQL